MMINNSLAVALISMSLATTGIAQTLSPKGLPARNYFSLPANVTPEDYMPNNVIIKIRKEYKQACDGNKVHIPALNNLLNQLGAQNFKQKFPHAEPPKAEKNHLGQKYADLTTIYEFNFIGNYQLTEVINHCYALGILEYAEPHYLPRLSYTPNDPQVGSQYHINRIKANLAWDVFKGDTAIVIGIVDSGTDIDHTDLEPNFKYNYNDPIDGVDNDADGYVDNFRGWDLISDDNNPDAESTAANHGTHVSGCASAATDNGLMVAGPGFNCRLLAVRAGSGQTIEAGYEGIEYMANHGADVINCSWGGPGGGQSGQDVIDYATINKGKLVVAAAGNDGVEMLGFPAAYKNVMAVASTGSTDAKAFSSTYGTWIDVAAPGENILATNYGGSTTTMSGTSMASPVAAGCAGMIKAKYPFLSGLQVGEQLRVTTDNIDAMNAQYIGKIGSGRVNLYKAVTDFFTTPSVVLDMYETTDNNDEAFVVNDTIRISANWINYLAATGNCTATITTTSTYVSIIDGTATIGTIGTNAAKDNNTDPFTVKINGNAPQNTSVQFKVTITDGTYTRSEYINFTINVDYINIGINDVATTITSTSLIGFNDFSTQLEGLGFIYPYGNGGKNLMFDGGLMIGVSGNVSDKVRGTAGASDNDISALQNAQRIIPPVKSEFDVDGIFHDDLSSTPLPVEVAHKAYAWSDAGHRKYVIVEYNIKNVGTANLNALYAGIFTDWDIDMGQSSGYLQNRGATDLARQLGYTFNTNASGLYAGIQLLTNGGFNHYAFDNDGLNGSISLYADYLSAQKYQTMSTPRWDAGASGQGNDISNVVSSGPFNIDPQSSVTIAFALIAGDDLSDLQKSADSAYVRYNGTSAPASVIAQNNEFGYSLFPNPASEISNLTLNLKTNADVNIKIIDLNGSTVMNVIDGSFGVGTQRFDINVNNLASGLYLYQITVNGKVNTERLTVIR